MFIRTRNPRRQWCSHQNTSSSIFLTILIIALFSSSKNVHARPYTFLISSRPSCVFLDLPNDTKIVIKYSAPDVILDKADTQNPYEKEISDSHLKEDTLLTPNNGEKKDMTDAEKRKAKLKALAADISNQHSDMTIAISKKRGRPLEKFPIESTEGMQTFTTVEDGTIQICTQSIMASRLNPRRISLSVFVYKNEIKLTLPEQNKVEDGFDFVEHKLMSLEDDMSNLVKLAHYSKDLDAQFQKQSLEMNAAATWWPLIQILVVLGTGFIQMNYILSFFKRKGLI